MRVFVVLSLAVTAACSDPSLNAAMRVTPDGVRVSPSVSTSIAGVGVAVSR